MNWEDILKAPGNPPQFGEGHKIKPEHGTRVAGGEISLQELRTALSEIQDNDPEPEQEEESLILVVFPNQNDDGDVDLEIGLFSYTGLRDYFGEGKTKLMINRGNNGPFGLFWIDQEYIDGIWSRRLGDLKTKIDTGLQTLSIKEMVDSDPMEAGELIGSIRESM